MHWERVWQAHNVRYGIDIYLIVCCFFLLSFVIILFLCVILILINKYGAAHSLYACVDVYVRIDENVSLNGEQEGCDVGKWWSQPAPNKLISNKIPSTKHTHKAQSGIARGLFGLGSHSFSLSFSFHFSLPGKKSNENILIRVGTLAGWLTWSNSINIWHDKYILSHRRIVCCHCRQHGVCVCVCVYVVVFATVIVIPPNPLQKGFPGQC